LVDSNLDWGQDLKGLKAWVERNKVEKIQLAYFGTANPIYYGIDADYLPGTLFSRSSENAATARKATYVAVSATYLMGYNLLNPNAYIVLRQQTTVAVIAVIQSGCSSYGLENRRGYLPDAFGEFAQPWSVAAAMRLAPSG
jgi:hypothetical protein